MDLNAATSSNHDSLAYEYDDVHIELDQELEAVDSSYNINDAITPDQSWLDEVIDIDHDAFYAEIRTIAPNLGQIYRDFSNSWSSLREYDAGFFWLSLLKRDKGISHSL